MIFDKNNIKKHIGDKIKLRSNLQALEPVEEYFRTRCKEMGLDVSYDCTAKENPHFTTLNYTTYAGLFIIHPLEFKLSLFQMYDAKADSLEPVGHIDYVKENSCKGKYTTGNGEEFTAKVEGTSKYVAVMPGSNKVYKHVSSKKLQHICEKHGKDLTVKPHPLTNEAVLADTHKFAKKATIASTEDNLYDLISKAELVYTTHISETALTALILGKKVSPLDPYSNASEGSFSHINHFCFTEENPLDTLGRIFASPKSGIVHPDVDKNWKSKVDQYLRYINNKRMKYSGAYFE
jgi:hypothetical protein